MTEGINKAPALFLDRDGTIIREAGYLQRMEDIEFLPGAVEAIRRINKAGWKCVIISNQSGVGRGYFSEETVRRINTELITLLRQEMAIIDGIYYCPHHPEGSPPYNIQCNCRKPAPGLVFKAAAELNIDIAASAIIGDKYSDVQTARRLGIPGILVLTGYGQVELDKIKQDGDEPPSHVEENLLDAVEWWFRHISQQKPE